MDITIKMIFYSKKETEQQGEYPNGSGHYYLQHFQTPIMVRNKEGKMVQAPKDSLFLSTPSLPLKFDFQGDSFLHTLVIFDARESFMKNFNIPIGEPFMVHRIKEIDQYFFQIQFLRYQDGTFQSPAASAYLILALSGIHHQLHSARKTSYANYADAVSATRLTMRSSTGLHWNAKMMASHANMGVTQFYKHYKEIYNKTPMEDLFDFRFEKAKILLENGSNISEILYSCGFKSAQHFSNFFKKRQGMSPTQYVKSYREQQKRIDKENHSSL
ncbi:MAG: helix-turn-helix domain-containing protein [Lachnospiraceae bacterium]